MATLELFDLDAWCERTSAFNDAVARTPNLMKVCSASAWQIAAHRAFCDLGRIAVWHKDGHWAAFLIQPTSQSTFGLAPIESMWGFGCPLVGPSAAAAVALLGEVADFCGPRLESICITGVAEGSELAGWLTTGIGRDFRSGSGGSEACDCADLSAGAAAYLQRRDPAFRSNLRRLQRRCDEANVRFEFQTSGCDSADVFGRILAIEAKSWKSRANVGFRQWAGGEQFYRQLTDQLAATGSLRALFARSGQADVAYAFGGVIGSEYRGFQIAYDDQLSKLGLGHMVQKALIERLAEEGIHTYDLGMRMPYKERWKDYTKCNRKFLFYRDANDNPPLPELKWA